MIDFELDDELRLLQETARSYASAWLRPNERRHEEARSVSAETRETFEKIGLAAVELPESLGGAALGSLARALVLEELAAADSGATLALDRLGPALYGLRECGESVFFELADTLLRTQESRALLFLDDSARIEHRDGRVRGQVPWLPADRVDLLVIASLNEVLVVREGTQIESLRGSGLRAAGASALHLEDAPVCARVADPGAAARARARARLYGAALLVGVMRASAESSRAYAVERVAFGRPIAHHQALAFLIADMASAVETSRLLVWEAAHRLDRAATDPALEAEAIEACATAFVEASEQSMFVTPNGVQILGGHGFMQDYPLEKWMREARALGLLFGGRDSAREESGAALAASEPPVQLTLREA